MLAEAVAAFTTPSSLRGGVLTSRNHVSTRAPPRMFIRRVVRRLRGKGKIEEVVEEEPAEEVVVAPVDLPTDWMAAKSAEGEAYYVNSVTGDLSWEVPTASSVDGLAMDLDNTQAAALAAMLIVGAVVLYPRPPDMPAVTTPPPVSAARAEKVAPPAKRSGFDSVESAFAKLDKVR